ncbi:MAG: tyrosine-type recombinase/integrase [Actinobacteria bacterium]|nr:tyrosine-type recombinase/integrase [Actinomycetota bacterium]
MSITKTRDGRWVVRWYVAGRGSARRQRIFDRKGDAQTFDGEVRRRRALGELALFEQRNRTLEELAREWWRKYAVPNLATWTLTGYERMLVSYVQPRLGRMRVGDITPEVVADFRERLEAAGVGRHSVRLSLVVLQSMFGHAIRWGWVQTNPVKAVPKPSGKRQRAVVCLAPAQVEAIRGALLAERKLYAATLVSLVAYQGLRVPEEVLALEVRHVRANTLLVEQRNICGEIVAGQKVRGFHPRAVDWVEPARRDVAEYLLALGIRAGPLFPRSDGGAWRLHDYKNWCRRVWHPAVKQAGIFPAQEGSKGKSSGLPPYDLRHAFASLQIRAGMSVPELAEQMGHAPQMTITTYTHVIRELKGLPAMSAEAQIGQARDSRGREVDVSAAG